MTMPPMEPIESGLWMNVGDVFHIKGRGTVVTGLLEGNGGLRVGDTLVCEGRHWTIGGLEAFRAVLQVAEAGSNIGVLLRKGPEADVLRGRLVQFVPALGTSAPPPPGTTNSRRKPWGRRG
jgi:elongation factor Tu